MQQREVLVNLPMSRARHCKEVVGLSKFDSGLCAQVVEQPKWEALFFVEDKLCNGMAPENH